MYNSSTDHNSLPGEANIVIWFQIYNISPFCISAYTLQLAIV